MIKLPYDLSIAYLDEYQAKIVPSITSLITDAEPIRIDDSELARIDTLGVQFILALVTYITYQGVDIIWKSKSDVLRESIEQLGITDNLLLQYIKN